MEGGGGGVMCPSLYADRQWSMGRRFTVNGGGRGRGDVPFSIYADRQWSMGSLCEDS